MKRRDFISTSMTAAAGSALLMNSGASLLARGQEKTQPLYFDGLTFLSGTKDDLKKSGLKSLAQSRKFLNENDQGLFLATKGSQVKEAFERGKVAIFLQFQSPGADQGRPRGHGRVL